MKTTNPHIKMKTLDSLNLIVPKLGIGDTRKIMGGQDYWGGYLQPSICNGDDYNSGSSWDSWYNDYQYDHADPDYGANSGAGGSPSYGGGSYGGDYDDVDSSTRITFGDNIDDSVKEQIKQFIQSLPEELQNQEIKIVIDPDLLKECSGSDDFSGVDDAVFLYASHSLNSYSTDVIILRDQSQIPDLFEEFLHVWQYNNCLDGESKMSNADRSAMEFQAAIIQSIDMLYNNPDNMGPLTAGLDEIIAKILNGFTDYDNSSFDINKFLSSISDTEWESYYDEWAKNSGYGDVNENYDWNWKEALEMIAGNNTSDTNYSSNPY